jgi:hypothetical protein
MKTLTHRLIHVSRAWLLALMLGSLLLAATAGSAAAAVPATVAVTPHGLSATFTVDSSPAAYMEISVSTAPIVMQSGKPTFSSVTSAVGSASKTAHWVIALKGLQPNTSYNYIVKTTYGDDSAYKTGTFKTLHRKLTVMFSSIKVTDDSDALGSGELMFFFKVNSAWQRDLDTGWLDISSGQTFFPVKTKMFMDAPDTLKLKVSGLDDDCSFWELCTFGIGPSDSAGGSTSQTDFATAVSNSISLVNPAQEAFGTTTTFSTTSFALKFQATASIFVEYVP